MLMHPLDKGSDRASLYRVVSVDRNRARHEATHSRTVAAIGELGFYLTYVTIGAIWGAAQGGSWNDLNATGAGNPFEKTAHTFTDAPGTAPSTNDR